MINKISKKDKKDWEDFISKDEKLPNKDLDRIKKNLNKTESIDLHGFSLDEANKEISNFINSCYEEGISKLRIVTGKGLHSNNDKDPYISKDLGILKYSVPDYIRNNLDLMKKIIEIKDAEIGDGGSGAFYIFLRKKL